MYTGNMNLEATLQDHIPLQDAALVPDVFGVEVELEGVGILKCPETVSLFWDQHKDGSLRAMAPGDETIEYVSRAPYNIQTTEEALTALFGFLNRQNCKVYESYRTSIHVHINFGVETYRTIYNFMTIALILDELLVSQNGEHRIGNNFCLRAKDAVGQITALIESIERGKNFFNVGQENRYSSINFVSLMKFGSIEFRSMECTTHLGRVMHWIGTLQHMKTKARTFINPVQIIQQYSMLGPRGFLQLMLGPFAYKYINVSDMENMLHSGMRLAQDFAYCSAWNEKEKEMGVR